MAAGCTFLQIAILNEQNRYTLIFVHKKAIVNFGEQVARNIYYKHVKSYHAGAHQAHSVLLFVLFKMLQDR